MQRFLPETNASDIAACRALLRNGSRSFFAASFLLPRKVREPASALYAFCRLADDAVDLDGCSTGALHRLRERLDRVYRGRPRSHPAERAFADVVAQFDIPRALPEALLDGLAWDAEGRRYQGLPELHDYSARVAGTVGAMMALLMGVRAPELLARACDLGVAMQLTNIARDVGEDARAGRIYLPLDWLSEAGIDADAWLAEPELSEALAGVLARLLNAADALYRRADEGITALPRACRPGIRAARLLYAEIGNELARTGFGSMSRRTVVPTGRKLELLARAVAGWTVVRATEAPCLAETEFLVRAVGATRFRQSVQSSSVRWWNFREQALWVINLFERLERRRRGGVEAEVSQQAPA
jgi:15-cis-phytoene synthase